MAIMIQCELLLTGCSLPTFMAKLLLQVMSKYHQSTSRFNEPHSIGGHITTQHNLCTDITNETISCEMLALDTLLELAIPSYSDMIQHHPESFVSTLRTRKAQSIHQRPPFGTYYENLTIGTLPGMIVHRSPQLSKHKLFADGVIIYIHGGGYVIGTFESDHPFMSTLHLLTGLPVLAVDYRLAPEFPLQSGALLEDAQKVRLYALNGSL